MLRLQPPPKTDVDAGVKDGFNAERQLIVLRALVRFNRHKLFVILEDNSLFNLNHVGNWLEQNKEKIELFPALAKPKVVLKK